jgi:hypothetical protein
MDRFFRAFPEFESEEDVNTYNDRKPEIIRQSSYFEPKPEKIETDQKCDAYHEYHGISEDVSTQVLFDKIADRPCYGDDKKNGKNAKNNPQPGKKHLIPEWNHLNLILFIF